MRVHFGLRARIAAAIVLVTGVATTMMAFAVYQLQASDTTDRFVEAARTSFRSDAVQAGFVARNLPGDASAAEAVRGFMSRERGVGWCVFFREPGAEPTRIDCEGAPRPVPPWMLATASDPADPSTSNSDDGTFVLLAGRTTPSVMLVEFYSMQSLRDELVHLRRSLTLIALVVTMAGVAAAFAVAKRAQRPVQAVAAAARRLGRGELEVRLPVRGRDELAELADAFNSMAHQMGDSIAELKAKDEQQRRFVADVAHDLRTPVAAMVAAADGMDRPAMAARSAELMAQQARRLGRIVEDLMEMSRFDAGVAELRPEPVDLEDLWADAAEAAGAGIELRGHGDLVVVGDPRRLHTVARNLLANALEHGAPPVTVDLDGTHADRVTVRVADSGPGVPGQLLPLVFDRFVRGDSARSASGGSGLGLAIVRENVRSHGGHVVAENAENSDKTTGGAVFTVTLPRQGSATED